MRNEQAQRIAAAAVALDAAKRELQALEGAGAYRAAREARAAVAERDKALAEALAALTAE